MTGYCYFGVGGALGFDTLAAKVLLELREIYQHIKLILVLPCIEQTKDWTKADIAVYEDIKNDAINIPTQQSIIIRVVCTNVIGIW